MAVGWCLLAWIAPAFAFDGGLDIRNTHQNGLAEDEEYSTNALRETVFLAHRFSLAKRLSLEGDVRWQRDLTESGFSGLSSESDRRTHQGGLRLNFNSRPLAMGTRAQWYSREYFGAGVLSPPRDRQEYEGWLKGRPGENTLVWASLVRNIGREENRAAGDTESHKTSGYMSLQHTFGNLGQGRYKLSGLSSDVAERDIREKQLSHRLEYLGTTNFAQKRGSGSFRALSSFFSQDVELGRSGESRFVLLPITGGFLLDDTPETLDPLEDDLTLVPELYDQDRDTPTIINLGDSATPVREVGGDFRNLQYDFADTVEMVSVSLYVDRQLLLPELWSWSVFVTNDPEGRSWTELGAAEANVQYREWDNDLQGWEVTLSEGITGRLIKIVDLKFGPTVEDLFVTELEVYTRDVFETRETTVRTEDHRLEGDVAYDLTPALRVGYRTMLRERLSVGSGRDISERNHSLHSRWKSGAYSVSGHVRLDRITSAGERTTNVRQYNLVAARGIASDFSTQISWDRLEDRSRDLRRTSNTVSGIASWRAAPLLHINQRVSYGVESIPGPDPGSESITLITSIRGTPLPNLTVTFDRSDRWVDREGGSGFMAFNNTGLLVGWTPVPLISVSSQVRYQTRRESDWYVRNFATWSPLRTRRFDLRFSGTSFYDSRTDAHESGVTASTRWRPRNRLLVDGSVGYQQLDVAGVQTTPLSTTIHVGWTF